MAEIAVAGEGPGAVERRRFRPLAAAIEALAAEGERRALWLPVFFGGGIAVYFAVTVEPRPWLGLAGTVVAAAMAVLLRKHPSWGAAAIALGFAAAGFAAAGFAAIQEAQRTQAAPMLQRRMGPVALTGRVVDLDIVERGWRIVIAPDPLPGLSPAEQPRHLRIHIPPSSDPLRPGDRVSLKAKLYPVPAQILPSGRDMQRELYFAGIGGVGYSFGGARRIAGAEVQPGGGWREWVMRLRAEMTERIHAVLPDATGGVASAVITGKRG